MVRAVPGIAADVDANRQLANLGVEQPPIKPHLVETLQQAHPTIM